jgi:hypothetical protein
VTGRAILRALISGETDPDGLVPCHLHGRLKATREQLVEALRGSVREHHRFLLKLHLTEVESLEAVIRQLEQRIETVLEPHRQAIDRLSTIPGVSKTTAPILLAEIGLDMSRFPTADHLVSWAGLCPVNDERRQAPLHSPPIGRPMAPLGPRSGRVAGRPKEELRPPRSVPPDQGAKRTEEGRRRRRRLHPHRGLLHPPPGRPLPGVRPAPSRPARSAEDRLAPNPKAQRPRPASRREVSRLTSPPAFSF